jgi:hypothetical protein
MKKILIIVVLAVVVLLFSTHTVMADYDAAQSKAIMQQVLKSFKDLNAKATEKDYYGTAEKFMDLAKLFKTLETLTPPRGGKAEWDRISEGIITSAFKGIGACGAKDEVGVKQAIGEIIKFRNEGHKMFMP